MKRLLSIAFAVVMAGSISTFVLAEGNTPSSTPPGSAKISQKIAVPQEIIDKKEVLKNLESQNQALQKELKSDAKEAESHWKALMKDNFKLDSEKLKEVRSTVAEKNKPLQDQLKQLNSDLKQAIKAKDKEKVISIMDKITALEQQIKTNLAESRKSYDELQKELTAAKELKKKAEALKAELKPLKDQEKPLGSQLKTQNESLKSYTKELKDAFESKDLTKVSTVMDKMIELRKSINTNLTKMLEVHKQIVEKLKSFK